MKDDLKLYVLSAVMGLVMGIVSIGFMTLVQAGTKLVWPAGVPTSGEHLWIIPVVLTVFGLLMGVCVKYFGVNRGMGFEAVMAASAPDGRIKPIQIPRVVLNGILGLVSGASIGPEAPLIAACGAVGSALIEKLKLKPQAAKAMTAVAVGSTLGILLDSPVAGPLAVVESGPPLERPVYLRLIISIMLATGVGLALSLVVMGPTLAGLNLVPAYPQFHEVDMLYGLAIGVVAGAVGLFARRTLEGMQAAGRRWDRWPVLRGGLSGLLMGVIGMALPLVLFAGDKELPQVVSKAGEYGFLILVVLMLAKLLSMGIAFAGGYQGGNIFPSLFIGGTMGLAIHAIFGFVPAPVAMIACMAGIMFALMPMPLFVVFLLAVISTALLIPVMAMALVGAAVVVLGVPLLTKKAPAAASA